MSETALYLGIEPVSEPITIYNDSGVSKLVQNMRRRRTTKVSGIHRVPCIIKDANHLVHPVLGPADETYSLDYVDIKLKTSAARTAGGMPGDEGWAIGHRDTIRLTLALAEKDSEDRLGVIAYRPHNIAEQDEESMRGVLDESLGYIALHADYSDAGHYGDRTMTLLGEIDTGELQELPFSTDAALLLSDRLSIVLRRDLDR